MGTGSSIGSRAASRPNSRASRPLSTHAAPDQNSTGPPSRHTAAPIMADEEEDGKSTSENFESVPLTELQQREVHLMLSNIGSFLKISFNREAVTSAARIVHLPPDEELISAGAPPQGVFIVEEGMLEVLSPSGGVVLAHLMNGDFCGELSVLLNQPCSTVVSARTNVTLIKLPTRAVRESMIGRLSKAAMKSWCIKRAYIDTQSMYPDGSLMLSVIIAALKASPVLLGWSVESLTSIARLCTPVVYSCGNVLAKIGEPSSHLYIIPRGSIEVTEGSTRRVKKVNHADESLTIGDEDFFIKRSRRQRIRAVGPLVVIPVTREALLITVAKFPSEKGKLMSTVAQYREHNTT